MSFSLKEEHAFFAVRDLFPMISFSNDKHCISVFHLSIKRTYSESMVGEVP
ncbi:hypothetical protein BLGI_360 [Brevibacillus laterosporus GI-9]|nr:hypothetical protein BLGI_360 [Brevibacillus laterosporus GI-9]